LLHTFLQVVSTKGKWACHLNLSKAHNLIFVTNYAAPGCVTAYAINADTGVLDDEPVYTEQYPKGSMVEPERQEGGHAHSVFFYKDNAYVADLGGDKIFHYRIVPAVDASAGRFKVEKGKDMEHGAGLGPRHMAVDKHRDRIYVLNELKNSVSVYNVDPVTGNLSNAGQEVPYMVENATDGVRQYGAGIEIDVAGKTLYVGNRGDGAIVVMAISDTSPYLNQIQGRNSPMFKNYSLLRFLTRFITGLQSILKLKNPFLGRSRPVKMQLRIDS
jgi:6-phosphogluconolactonase